MNTLGRRRRHSSHALGLTCSSTPRPKRAGVGAAIGGGVGFVLGSAYWGYQFYQQRARILAVSQSPTVPTASDNINIATAWKSAAERITLTTLAGVGAGAGVGAVKKQC